MYLSENIRYLRTKKGLSQEFIAEKLGYKSFTTIQKWESGVSEPPVKKLKELSILLGADMDDMNNIDLSKNIQKKEKASITIKVLGCVAAGIPIDAIEDIIQYGLKNGYEFRKLSYETKPTRHGINN